MKKRTWYKLDNAAKIYPPISNEKRGSMFSLSAILFEKIDGEVLNKAVNIILERFPTFKVRLKRGIFWYYLEENRKPFFVKEEPADFLAFINENKTNDYLFEVFYYNNKITLSVFHCLTDGTGGMEFLKALIYEYLVLKGHKIKANNSLKTIYSPPTSEENDDQFLKVFDKNIGKPDKEKRAFTVSGTNHNILGNSITTGTMSVQDIKTLAKKHNTTVTGYVCGLLMHCVNQSYIKDKKCKNKLVKVLVPVNMRKIYKSKTVRNFALFTRPQHNFNKQIELNECISVCDKQLKDGTSKQNMDKLIYSNVAKEKNLLMKITPLFIKDIAIKIGYSLIGDNLHTITFSNLGIVSLPEEFNEYVDKFLFSIGASYSCKMTVSLVSFNDKLTITFSKTIVENNHERLFFQTLAQEGVKIEIDSNYWEELK